MDILFKVIKNRDYHKDFLIKIGTIEILADTYYFWRDEFATLSNPYEAIMESISRYLDTWAKRLEELKLNESVFIPIDFSDEYVSGFNVKYLPNDFDISYGYITDISDMVVRVTTNEVYTNLNNKEFKILEPFNIERTEFMKLLRLTI